ncbi:MAG: ABC transporter ATP-binding protein [Desulfobacteraceae bacterium]|nr:MAG: ABC transporter ATP-binding protein [Desulfobacteraceae bacterium]
MGLEIQKVEKSVGREVYLKDIALSLAPGSRNIILGHTLAGKTSLLRIIAGLDKPTQGRILLGGKDVTGVTVRKRSVAMVYQQFINYPSLTVYQNIASPLKLARIAPSEIDRRVRRTAEMLHIDNLLDRLPAELSGGQQQRTAIARALVKESQLLLLDEPLVNLDYKLREELRVELQQIFEQRSAIVVYTTTEPAEALMLGGNIVIMDEGRILQTGPTYEVYRHPATTRVAEIFSDPPINFISARVRQKQARLSEIIRMPLAGHINDLPEGDYTFGVRCNHLRLNATSAADLEIRAVVELSELNGSETFIHVKYGDQKMVVQENGVHQFKIGTPISVYVNPCHFFVYDPKGHLAASPEQACYA